MRTFVLAVIAAMFVIPVEARLQRQIIGSEQDHSLTETTDCDHFYKTTFTSFKAQLHEQEQREIPLDGVDLLKVNASEEGGVSIRGWNKPHARLIVCRYAVAGSKSHARRVLDAITVSHANGEITAHGPAIDPTQAWWVNMILYVPKRATMDVRAANGGVAIRDMDGRVSAQATSGGISVAQSTGNYKIATESGGITLDRISGRVEAESREGAIAFKVAPADTTPAIEAKTADQGHILCRLSGCQGGGLGTWTADRKTLRIGSGTPDVRLTTSGAPIIIDRLR
jgi:hypothetical protein